MTILDTPTLDEICQLNGIAGVHPAAKIFPMMSAEELDALVADVRENGFTSRVVVTDDDLLLDGRNRLLASWIAQFDVGIRRFNPTSPIQYVLSENLHRRHLSQGQRAFIAFEALPLLEAEARERMLAGQKDPVADLPQGRAPLSRDKAAELTGTSGRAVAQAKRIEQHAPDLRPRVESGAMSLDAAHREAAQRQRDAPALESAVKKDTVMLTLRTHRGDPVEYPKPQSKATFNPTNEHISWAAWSWNPVTGCLHGCEYCYARDLANKASYAASYPVGFTPLFHSERLDAPANTHVPAGSVEDPRKGRVFVCSMADLYGRWVPQDWIDQVHQSCIDNPQWDYLMLTKFPARYVDLSLPPTAWLGTSVDEQKRVRIAEDAFRKIDDVAVKWLSLEPLREPLEFTDLSMFDWVVIGSQTETQQPEPIGKVPAFAPPFEWVARIVAQAREAGCRVYLKPNLLGQTGPQSPGMQLPQEEPVRRNVLGE